MNRQNFYILSLTALMFPITVMATTFTADEFESKETHVLNDLSFSFEHPVERSTISQRFIVDTFIGANHFGESYLHDVESSSHVEYSVYHDGESVTHSEGSVTHRELSKVHDKESLHHNGYSSYHWWSSTAHHKGTSFHYGESWYHSERSFSHGFGTIVHDNFSNLPD